MRRTALIAQAVAFCLLMVAVAPAQAQVNLNLNHSGTGIVPYHAALDEAAALWSSWLESPYGPKTLNITTQMVDQGSNFLATASSNYDYNSNAQLWYSRSIGHYTGATSSNNAGTITFNPNHPWCACMSHAIPSGNYDIVTVAIHEIGHIMGMSASYSESNNRWGRSTLFNLPGTFRLRHYDTFLRDQHGNAPSVSNNNFDVTGDVVWVGANAVAAYGSPVPMYSPNNFAQGSSLSHHGTTGVMFFALGSGLARRGLYDYERGIFEDLGWVFKNPENLRVNTHWGQSGNSGPAAEWHDGTHWGGDVEGLSPVATTHVEFHMPTATSNYTLAVNRSTAARSLTMGGTNSARALLNINGGALSITENVTVGDRNGANARITVNNNGTLNVGQNLAIGQGGIGNVTLNNGGTLNVSQAVNIFNNGTLAFSGGSHSFGGPITNNGGTLFFNTTTSIQADYHINNGTTQVLGTNITARFFGDVTGSGNFTGNGTVDFRGFVSPGQSAGIMSFSNNLFFGGTATLLMEIGGTTLGTEYDHISVTNSLLLQGTLLVELIDGFMPSNGDAFTLFSYGTLINQFGNILLPELTGSLDWDASELYTSGVLMVIPEPATVTLFATTALLLTRRRRAAA